MTRESAARPSGIWSGRKSIHAVFFDFADTLFSSRMLRDVHLRQLRFVGDTIGVTASDDELRANYRKALAVAYRSVASRPYYLHRELFGQAFLAMARTFGRDLDHEQIGHAVDRQYQATVEAAELRADCLDSLCSLRELGLHVQIVSNIDEEQLKALVRRLGLGSAIDACTSSESARSCKPDPGIYGCALEKAYCTAQQVLFVGDSPAHDVSGPQAMGMLTALLVADAKPGIEDCSPDFVIERLGQVVEIIEQEFVG
ncbi:MAG: HAD family hydrolase [Acidimicrobiales bacterium]